MQSTKGSVDTTVFILHPEREIVISQYSYPFLKHHYVTDHKTGIEGCSGFQGSIEMCLPPHFGDNKYPYDSLDLLYSNQNVSELSVSPYTELNSSTC